MSDNTTYFNSKNYVDIQGISSLKGQLKKDPKLVRKEVAQQFESLFVQMMLKSMRSANEAFTNGESHSDAFTMYQELFDKQISLSSRGIGISKQIENYLNRISPEAADEGTETATNAINLPVPHFQQVNSRENARHSEEQSKDQIAFNRPVDFVKSLWNHAKTAAELLGVSPKLLLAQAALETNWGKNIISHTGQDSSYNLFNIKADPSWKNDQVSTLAIEQQDGLFVKQKSSFRKYESFADSFHDYVHFIKSNPRYSKALENVSDPEAYIQSLQKAHFATDKEYADKIMNIYNSRRFNELIKNAKLT